MLQWFIRFHEFDELTEFNDSSAPFRKNSIVFSQQTAHLTDINVKKVRLQ